ncbi:ParB-like nuclease [Bordetella ansorpii]|uniref:ParB-like nuclease n=1 Tax=Bordetella ansorpii TaxID=288768 RepID=A0A157QMH3_9BORD|nr:ParB/Srx family N-terminal domain-containing protein [Bordetella ansorpii]SAI46818.1 ParB-like nuclease [Bordetella ansorpii]
MKVTNTELAAVQAASPRQDIAHSALRLTDKYQARPRESLKTDPEVRELRATIAAMGGMILQNLIVVDNGDGTYDVCAGGRRWTALSMLIEAGELPADHPVPCLIIPARHALNASLIENIARKAMHPADVFTTYARLRAENWSVPEIAIAHGVSEVAVRKLLALGEVAPALLAQFRKGSIELADMQALASVPDHARQQAAWQAARHNHPYRRAAYIRQLLADAEIRGDSVLARYITVAAYERDGGNVRRDLFAKRGEDVYLTDVDKVRVMVVDKLKRSKLARTVGKESWAWVEFAPSFGHEQRSEYGQVQPVKREPTVQEAARLQELDAQLDDLDQRIDAMRPAWEDDSDEDEAGDEDDDQDDDQDGEDAGQDAQLAALQRERLVLGQQRHDLLRALRDYPTEFKALAGTIVYLDASGEPAASRGLVREQAREAVAALVRAHGGTEDATDVQLPRTKQRAEFSAPLVRRLQAQRTIALQAEVMIRPQLVQALLIEQLLGRNPGTDVFDLRADSAHDDLCAVDDAMRDSPAWRAVQERYRTVMADLPEDEHAVLPWLLAQSQDRLNAMLALLLARIVYRREARSQAAPTEHLDRLAELVDLDMTTWWTATERSYLGHVSKAQIAQAVTEGRDPSSGASITGMKKANAVQTAQALLAGTGWLPGPLRRVPVATDPATTDPGTTQASPDVAPAEPDPALATV